MPSHPNPEKVTFSFLSLNKFARTIGIPLRKLFHLADTAERRYAPFPKKTGNKIRIIDNPTDFLKFVQRQINSRILAHFPFPPYVVGGIKGRDPLWHPSLHIKTPVVVTIDVKDCFPGISNKRIYELWCNDLGCSPPVASLATRLTTHQGHLPLGAPTSNALANIVLLQVAKRIWEMAREHGFRVSQYIDDQALSGEVLHQDLITLVIREFSRHGFTVNRKKVTVMRSGGSQQVTKKNINRKVSIPKPKREILEARLHALLKTDVYHPVYEKLYRSVKGTAHSIGKLHPAESARLLNRIKILPLPLKNYSYSN